VNGPIPPINRHPVGCAGLIALWLILTYNLPGQWGVIVGATGLIGYAVWAAFQKHEPPPEGALTTVPRQKMIRVDIRTPQGELETLSRSLLLRPAEADAQGGALLRPSSGDSTADPALLLRGSSAETEERPQDVSEERTS
jgi:hypothetical protein